MTRLTDRMRKDMMAARGSKQRPTSGPGVRENTSGKRETRISSPPFGTKTRKRPSRSERRTPVRVQENALRSSPLEKTIAAIAPPRGISGKRARKKEAMCNKSPSPRENASGLCVSEGRIRSQTNMTASLDDPEDLFPGPPRRRNAPPGLIDERKYTIPGRWKFFLLLREDGSEVKGLKDLEGFPDERLSYRAGKDQFHISSCDSPAAGE